VLAGAVHLLHAVQTRRGARDLLPLATAAEDHGDMAAAARFLGNYLTLVPDDVDIRVRHGELLARLPSPAARNRALETFAEVLRRQPGRHDVRRQFVRVALDLDRFHDAEVHLAALQQSFPGDSELELAQGRCLEASKEYARAAELFARAIDHDPHQVDAYVRLARLLRLRLDRPQRADRLMDSLVTANEQSFRAYLGRGRYRKEFGALADAARDLQRAEELAPEEADVLLAGAELARARGDHTEARRRLERCRALFPQNLRLFQELAALETAVGRRSEAIACLQQGLQVLPEQPDLLLAMVDLLLQEYDLAGSSAVINRLNQSGFPVEHYQFLQARLLLQQGRWAEAALLLEWVRARAPAADLLNQVELALGQCYDQLDDPERQLATYRRAVERDPLSPALRLALGSTLAAQGRIDEAVGEYYEALTLPGAPASGWILLARTLVQRNRTLPAEKRGWPQVERLLDQAEQALPGSTEVALLRAEVRLGQGLLGQASTVLTTAGIDRPAVAAAWADFAAALGQWDDALRVLDEASRRQGDSADLRLARARCWARRGTPEASAQLAEAAHDWERLTFTDQVRLFRGLAEVYTAAGDSRAAGRFWTLLAERQPCDLRVRLLLFDQALREEDPAATQRWLSDLRRIEGDDGPHWRYAEAARIVERVQHGDKKDAARARQLLDEAAARRRTWSRVPLLAAHLAEAEGKPRDAVTHYLRAIELGEQDPGMLRRTAQLLTEQGRTTDARRLLRRVPR
jgi:tetratricopeptide (TPR) repeat protein